MNQETIRIHPSWGNDKWSDPDSGSATSGALDAEACSPVFSDTPETDRKIKRICGNWNNAGDQIQEFVLADVARKLERERDEARATVRDVLSALVALEHEGPRLAAMRVMDERDTARAVAVDAIREIERILETGDTYCTREIVQNLKDSLRGSSSQNADVEARRP